MSNYAFENYYKFDKDCDNLFKQCRTLKEDLELLKNVLLDDLTDNGGELPQNKTYVRVNRLKSTLPVFKVKKFRCKYTNKGNRSLFRVIFAYHKPLSLIYFIEFYKKKKDKTEMNKKRAVEACNFICNQ